MSPIVTERLDAGAYPCTGINNFALRFKRGLLSTPFFLPPRLIYCSQRPMKILAVSDFIEPLASDLLRDSVFADVELIISCGDLSPDYLSALHRAFAAPLYYIRGNHDIRYESSPPKNGFDIHTQVVPFKGLTILGLEGSHWYNGGPLQYTESQMRQTIRLLGSRLRRRGRLDIVATHAPPRHIHDSQDLCHRGFQAYNRLIDRYRPRYFLHGHIHRRFNDPAERITRIGKTQVINCSGYYLLDVDTNHA